MMDILLIDDEPDLLKAGKMFLEKDNAEINVETVNSAKKGLDMLEEDDYDAVVSDYKMPDMDGLELIKNIREDDIDTLFYILTGKGNQETSRRALELGATGYFEKSADSEEGFQKLYDVLVESMEKRRKMDNYLVAWIAVRKTWGQMNYDKFVRSLRDLSEILGFEVSEVKKKKVSPVKENIKAYTDKYHGIPREKSEKAEKWKEIVSEENEVVDAGYKCRKIQIYDKSDNDDGK